MPGNRRAAFETEVLQNAGGVIAVTSVTNLAQNLSSRIF